mgnify:CR=1 FL=1
MRGTVVATAALVAIVAMPGRAAAGDDVIVAADEVSYDPAASSVVASGGVSIAVGPLAIEARGMTLDLGDGSILLDGARLVLDLPGGVLSMAGDSASFDDGVLGLRHGSGTLCRCERPTWALEFEDLSVEGDGDVLIRHGWLLLLGRRVLPVPWLLFRTGRKPGLGVPEIGFGPRGFTFAMGASFPLPGSWDLALGVGWIAPDGMSISGTLGPPGSGVRADLVLDPVPGGVDSGWIRGSLAAGASGWRAGLVLDLPLAVRSRAGDFPGPGSHAGRIAVDALAVVMSLPVPYLFVAGGVSAAQSVSASPGAGGVDLIAGEAWIRLPSIDLVLLPVRVLGPRVPLTLAVEAGPQELLPVHAPPGAGLLPTSGVGLDLLARFRPLGALHVELRAGWDGSVSTRADGQAPPVWIHRLVAGAGIGIGIVGPAGKGGARHLVEAAARYAFTEWGASGAWSGAPAPLASTGPSGHVAGVSLVNSILIGGAAIASLETAAWLVSREHDGAGAILSASLDVGVEAIRLHAEADLPSSTWLPSLLRTGARATVGGVTIVLEHLYVDPSGPTRLDVDDWISPLVRAWARGGAPGDLNLGIAGMSLPAGPGLLISWAAGVDLDAGRASFLRAALAWSPPCDCLEARLEVIQRAGVPVPEVFVTLGL